MFFNFGISEPETYAVEVFLGNALTQTQTITMPPEFAQGQFQNLCIQAKESGQPMTIKMSKKQQIWDEFENKTKELDCWIEYSTYDKEGT